MQRGRISIVPALELFRFVLEVHLYQSDLIDRSWISRNHSLDPALLGHLENMQSLCHVEWHHLMRHCVHMLLACPSRK